MERKPNEEEIKSYLQEKLKGITFSQNEQNIEVVTKENGTLLLNKSETERFGFKFGDFVQVVYGCRCHPKNEIALCVGVAKGCPGDPENEELWFLFEEDNFLSHFCGDEKEEFERRESGGRLLRL